MATVLDEIFVPLALEMVGQFGKVVSHDPVGGEADQDVHALIEAPEPSDFPGALVAKGARKLSIAGAEFDTAPKYGDRFTIDGRAYTVPEKGVAPIYSGEQVALYLILAAY
jgi:hypothetical protein